MRRGFQEPEPKKAGSASSPEKTRPPVKKTAVKPPDAGEPKRFDRNGILGLTGTLFLITLVVALMLGIVNQVTEPEIERITREKQEAAMRLVLEADTYEPVEGTPMYRASRDGQLVGYVVSVAPIGYGGEISMMVGVDLQPVVTGVSIVSMAESPGYGAKALENNYMDQFSGRDVSMAVGEDIDAIAGATITTDAIVGGVRDALTMVIQHLSEEGGEG